MLAWMKTKLSIHREDLLRRGMCITTVNSMFSIPTNCYDDIVCLYVLQCWYDIDFTVKGCMEIAHFLVLLNDLFYKMCFKNLKVHILHIHFFQCCRKSWKKYLHYILYKYLKHTLISFLLSGMEFGCERCQQQCSRNGNSIINNIMSHRFVN